MAAALILQGCGDTPGDVLAFEVSGGPLRAKQIVIVTDDGRGSCDRGSLKDIPNQRLIDAQALAHDAKSLAESGASYGGPRPGARRYLLKLPQGDVSWTEGTPGLPPALARAQLLALQLGRQLCGRA